MDKRLKTHSLSKCRQKSYSGSFRSPKKESNLKFLWILLIFPVVLIIAIIFLLSSNAFNLKTISVEGLDDYKKEKIENIISEQRETRNIIFSQESVVFFSKSQLAEELNSFNFSKLSITKNIFKKKLVITVQEREKAIIFLEKNYYYFADREGNIVNRQINCQNIAIDNTAEKVEGQEENSSESTEQSEQSKQLEELRAEEIKNCLDFNDQYRRENLFPFIENIGRERVTENGKNIKIDNSYIDFSLKLYNDLSENSEFGLNRIVLDEEYNTIKARLNNNIDLYFSFKEDYMEQISRFFTLKRERGAELKAQKYIDLRYGDKIFYY